MGRRSGPGRRLSAITSRLCSTLATFVAIVSLLFASVSPAQQHGADAVPGRGTAPDVPAGSAVVRGQLVHPDGAAKAAGASIVLYALSPDGSPGVRSGKADATGGFRFENISNAPSIIYLIGAQFASVPYGERFQFKPDQSEVEIEIAVADPTDDARGVRVGRSTLKVDWIGNSLAIEETHQLLNPEPLVIFVPPSARQGGRPAFRARLPENATDVDTQYSGFGDGFAFEGREVSFWGPVYQGDQEIRYRYMLPIPGPGSPLEWFLESGSREAVILYPAGGPDISGPALMPGADVTQASRKFYSLEAGAVAAGGAVEFEVALPETRSDPDAVRFSNIDVWLESDDTFQEVTVEITIDVDSGLYLAGDIDTPLLHFDIARGAELMGLSPNSQSIGMVPSQGGGLDLIGPLAPGQTNVSYRYRTAVSQSVSRLDLNFPGTIAQLNVLIADTGLVIDTQRLHRRRPFRSGTRVFLHRQAFQVATNEIIELSLTPIVRNAPTRNASMIATTGIAAIGVWFVFAPLGLRRGQNAGSSKVLEGRGERELIYAAIRDLDLDYETGNLDLDGYETMQQELRGRALGLLQAERDAAAGRAPGLDSGEAAEAPAPESTPTPQTLESEKRIPAVRFCPSCGEGITVSWRFCASCGGHLPGAGEGESTPGSKT